MIFKIAGIAVSVILLLLIAWEYYREYKDEKKHTDIPEDK